MKVTGKSWKDTDLGLSVIQILLIHWGNIGIIFLL